MRSEIENIDLGVYKRYARPIVHLRQQLRRRKFGPVLGAGLSQSLGFPNWDTLITDILSNDNIGLTKELRESLLAVPPTTRAQVAFEVFQAKRRKELTKNNTNYDYDRTTQIRIRAEWRRIIREALYKGSPCAGHHLSKSPLFFALTQLIHTRKVELVVNYNFDDSVEQALQFWRQKDIREEDNRITTDSPLSLGYQTVWSMSTQRDPECPTIYHPNGFISHRPQDLQSGTIVFSDDEFSDQLANSMSGEFSSLIHFLTQNTCLFIGLSMRDYNLRYLLHQAKNLSPGNVHYYVDRTEDTDRHNHIADGIFRARLSTSNLYTMFLSDREILSLFKWLTLSRDQFKRVAKDNNLTTKYVYYVTGAPAVGKSTVVSSLRGFGVVGEWLEPSTGLPAKDFAALSDEDVRRNDLWISRQFRLKNQILDEESEGIFVVDRAPLDPLAYQKSSEERMDRAKSHRDEVCKGKNTIHEGALIVLRGDKKELTRRLEQKGKDWSQSSRDYLINSINEIYSTEPLQPIETSDFSVEDVLERAIHVILLEKYVPINYGVLLDGFINGSVV